MGISDDKLLDVFANIERSIGAVSGTVSEILVRLGGIEKMHTGGPARAAYIAKKSSENTTQNDVSFSTVERAGKKLWPVVSGALLGAATVGYFAAKFVF